MSALRQALEIAAIVAVIFVLLILGGVFGVLLGYHVIGPALFG